MAHSGGASHTNAVWQGTGQTSRTSRRRGRGVSWRICGYMENSHAADPALISLDLSARTTSTRDLTLGSRLPLGRCRMNRWQRPPDRRAPPETTRARQRRLQGRPSPPTLQCREWTPGHTVPGSRRELRPGTPKGPSTIVSTHALARLPPFRRPPHCRGTALRIDTPDKNRAGPGRKWRAHTSDLPRPSYHAEVTAALWLGLICLTEGWDVRGPPEQDPNDARHQAGSPHRSPDETTRAQYRRFGFVGRTA